ncbi:Gfo/Idh/MocA family protein [Phycisphaera mikurensis]|uniref:Putative oxidoreductase n=1 Tax=Phycisphaera mikurensis (strain NBRC 102666 / KCTC 22515 / FYK2301M01) TaxID=1142394 RepID=I0ICT0_PHYMF|nr:Gfo/Idh/MocA family oxidoreductase [Phycisphaera mikurensis]MBB6443312.1 putative dehydrogenase [Phycisphaera mikurensis]BAM03068.1 putative oxidoreductase [Phycisphaera mikurensis NBRC 102666]
MSDRPLRIGVVGLGSMGLTHLQAYSAYPDAVVAAVADRDPRRLSCRAGDGGGGGGGGNIEGQGGGVVPADAARYVDADELISEADLDVTDICLPTPLHERFGLAAMAAGRHVLIEKPLARDAAAADRMADAADRSPTRSMAGMCMRFWPGWVELRQAVRDGRYGRVLAATFRRVTSHPQGPFYADGSANGGALLDLHVHDADFVRWTFGEPDAVESVGYARDTDEIDHVTTRYHYAGGPVVIAEGCWSMASGFGFEMRYCVNLEHATLDFDLGRDPAFRCITRDGASAAPIPAVDGGTGYGPQLRYFLDCIRRGRPADRVTLRDAAASVRLVEAEAESIRTGSRVTLARREARP